MPVTHRTSPLRGLLAGALLLALSTSAVLAAGPPVMGNDAFRVVTPDWVAQHAGDAGVRILDVRTSVADHQYGHVPNAVFLPNDALRAPLAGVPVQYLDAEEMASLFRRAGINTGDTVVVYADGKQVLGATMVAYGLHRVGHRNVAILDGGIDAYRNRHPLDQVYPAVTSGSLSPNLDSTIFATLDDVKKAMGDPAVLLLDTRPTSDYLGNTSRWMRNGHIPGAVNLDWHRLMDAGNPHAFRSPAEMRTMLEAVGATKDRPIIAYCGTSREATLVYQVLRNVLGYPQVKLYEGSWTEYSAKTAMPVARHQETPGLATAAAHTPPTTDRLEPYQCGTVQRLHTMRGVFLASQPTPGDFEQAKMGGVKTVINSRHAKEIKEFNEREVVESLGLTYFNPAWNGPDQLTDAILDETRRLLRTAERPILFHCSSANRTGAIWAAYRVLDEGITWDEALAEAKTVGLTSPDYERIVKDYVQRKQAEGRQSSAATLSPSSRDALLAALDDERRAQAFYAAVMSRHGERRPFTNIIRAERQHEREILALLETYGIEVPADAWPTRDLEVADTFIDACRQAARFERENVAMYDELLTAVPEADIRTVMERLQRMSRERHLPAFERWAGS